MFLAAAPEAGFTSSDLISVLTAGVVVLIAAATGVAAYLDTTFAPVNCAKVYPG